MTTASIEKRLTAIEQDLAQLKAERNPAKVHPVIALERIHATFENDESFQEAARLGRKWRESQRPKTRKTKGKRK
jgi:hypothetical protein